MVIYRCWCLVATGQDSFVAVADMTLVASAVDEMALVAAAADMAMVVEVVEMDGPDCCGGCDGPGYCGG